MIGALESHGRLLADEAINEHKVNPPEYYYDKIRRCLRGTIRRIETEAQWGKTDDTDKMSLKTALEQSIETWSQCTTLREIPPGELPDDYDPETDEMFNLTLDNHMSDIMKIKIPVFLIDVIKAQPTAYQKLREYTTEPTMPSETSFLSAWNDYSTHKEVIMVLELAIAATYK